MPEPERRVVLIAGPSGAGKSRVSGRLDLPVLPLDDYYKDGDDPTLPRFASGTVDWDHPQAWNAEHAGSGIRALCHAGQTDAPVYDISRNGRVGHRVIDASGAVCFVAEGIFAAELVAWCRAEGLLATAICVRRSRWVTFALRLTRDLREHRKPPLLLLRRGWWLARREPEIVAALVAKGCTPMTPREAEALVSAMTS
ncbi:MAG: ATP-binding protein [Nocardioidaceae bacterium]